LPYIIASYHLHRERDFLLGNLLIKNCKLGEFARLFDAMKRVCESVENKNESMLYPPTQLLQH